MANCRRVRSAAGPPMGDREEVDRQLQGGEIGTAYVSSGSKAVPMQGGSSNP
jgi:hypothetical protein